MVAAASVSSFFDCLPARLVQVLPVGVSVTFALSGEQGGTWTVQRFNNGEGCVLAQEPEHPDCRLECTALDFQALVEGSLDPREAFLKGRFDVEGDVGLVLRLHRCLATR